jgi:hypothetical protein
MVFNTRTEIIKALQTEFNENPAGFNNNERTKSREKFWTFNRLLRYYWDMKQGRKQTFRTVLNPETGYYELSIEYKQLYNIK